MQHSDVIVWFLNYDYRPNGRQREGGGEEECVFLSDVCCVGPYMVPYDCNRGRKERERKEVNKERGKKEGECVSSRLFLMLIIRMCVYVRYQTTHF